MKLNDRQIKNAKPAEKPFKLNDGKGLYLYINTSGGKLWRFDFSYNGKRKTLSIGKYPTVSLVEARAAAENARRLLVSGQDPSEAKQQEKRERQAAALNTFEAIARRWHSDNLIRWKENHAARVLRYFETDVFPVIGEMPIQEIRVSDIKTVLDGVMTRGVNNTAEKIREWTGSIFDYAVMLEVVETNPAYSLRKYIPAKQTDHRPALPREELTEFFRRLILAEIEPQNRIALILNMLTFLRSTELRGGQWNEIDFDAAIWTVPAQRMKHEKTAPKPPHAVPLADWTLELLAELKELTGNTPFLFPSRTKTDGFISDATISRIIERMGYKGRVTPHGFRSLASSVLNEQGFNPDAIERQLAHIENNKIRAAYNRADYLNERKEFMQWYSDFLRERYNQALQMIQDGKTD
ncbi:integrase arm-type DNA-binding domain-containing protein [Neisseria mucosa]|uniref:Integrase arm-type DNA-binding domain-containing protein n=2 Tax=Neisseria TaxID=482 RepID=A0AAW6Z458_NEIMU|nr:integrase arm-type DNA-binding domain-containing protein [Neisseria mucosa]DAI56835.1 MAG TPA: Integrase [Caudoviricetes sp.]MDK6725620.1 integrase arm-type DNA-binding domain-containing protein [Neisseria mucosa]MDK6869996.1 integrase arm-type DNA-binding domain-containing protein [Neisseria mucosa]MDK8109581.1 integrase arm-type DNA-binding domain-containing protein [Neisseria mucosa]MDK8360864.1 integrase arm-type DNA-binding domain-containing protein [Neisseria mucosa]